MKKSTTVALALTFVTAGAWQAHAQNQPSQQTIPAAQSQPTTQSQPAAQLLKTEQLQQLVAPIALYPDTFWRRC
jgi:hypothetical protein